MLNLKVITAEESLYEGEVQAVFFPGTAGEFEVLPHHADFLSSLEAGTIRIREEGGNMCTLKIRSGFVRIEKDNISACVVK